MLNVTLSTHSCEHDVAPSVSRGYRSAGETTSLEMITFQTKRGYLKVTVRVYGNAILLSENGIRGIEIKNFSRCAPSSTLSRSLVVYNLNYAFCKR